MAKKKYRILADVNIEGTIYKAGGLLRCDELLGDPHVGSSLDDHEDAVGYCEKQGMKLQDHESEPAAPTGDEVTIDEIVEAIKLLDPDKDEDYTGSGKPQVDALEALLEKDVSAAQRDEAFAKFTAGNE